MGGSRLRTAVPETFAMVGWSERPGLSVAKRPPSTKRVQYPSPTTKSKRIVSELKILRPRSDEDASGAGIRCRSGHGTADLLPILAQSSPFWAWSMLNAMFWRPPQDRMLARNALVLLLATVPATATATENDSQSANSIMPGCNAWLAQLSRGSTALGSNLFLAGECMGIVGTILYFSRDFSFSSAACPPANVTYNQAIQIVTAYISARPQRIQERFIDLATEALHDAWPCKPNLK
jgi:Rap1a immunity proteins